jgi:rod shape-determining protein MreC
VVAVRDTPRSRLLLGAALIAALSLIAVDYAKGSSPIVGSTRSAAGSALGAAERAISAVTRPVRRFLGAGLSGTGNGGQVATLERQLASLRAQLTAAEVASQRSHELSALLRLANAGTYRVLPAAVIAFGQGYQQTVTLDVGSAQGVRPQQTVLDGDGLVGQVISVSGRTCTVLLASAPNSVVGVRLAPGGEVGWVTGQGGGRPGLLTLQVLDPAAKLTIGEPLVTSASVADRPFVPGVPVGVIAGLRNRAASLTTVALVRPYARLTALDVVAVVVGPPRHNPGFSALPRPPGLVAGRPQPSGLARRIAAHQAGRP